MRQSKGTRRVSFRWSLRGAAIGGVFACILALLFANAVLAASWADVPFPEGETAQAIVQDSAGNVWATTLEASGTFGHVEVLRAGTSEWQDACQGLSWVTSSWSNGLTCTGGKLFLTTENGTCFARSIDDLEWHPVDSLIRFGRLTEWNGSLWSGTDLLGVARLDPASERSELASDGLLVVVDNAAFGRAYQRPAGNSEYLYAGQSVSTELAAEPDFEGVTVYRLEKGGSTWENTGLDLQPNEGDLAAVMRGTGGRWGVANLVAMDGYVFCQVMVSGSSTGARCFLYDEESGTWSSLAMPKAENGWYYLASGDPCFVRDGRFYFPTDFVSDGVVCDVLNPASQSWSQNVTVDAISWAPFAAAQMVGNQLVVAYRENEGSGAGETSGQQPSFVESVPLPTEISTDPGVIGTNFGLALLFAVIFGFTSTLFNNTLESNHDRIMRTFAPLGRAGRATVQAAMPGLRRFGNWLKAFTFRSAAVRAIAIHTPHLSRRWIEPLFILVLASFIYAFLDPTFGFSGHGTEIFFSLFVAVVAVTGAYDGIQALVSSRGYHIPAALRLFPAAIVLAVLCVLLSRLTGFTPGYLYGFIGALAFLGAQDPDERKMGRIVLISSACLLVLSMAAWFLAMPVAKAVDAGAWWAPFVESICAATFVAGLEGLLFGLAPLQFLDGGSLFRWSKVLWSVTFGVALFLFWHVLLNKNSKYGAAFEQTNTQVVLVLLGFWTLLTVGTYLIFRTKRQRPQPAATTWPGACQGPFGPGGEPRDQTPPSPMPPSGAPQTFQLPPPPPPPSAPPPPPERW